MIATCMFGVALGACAASPVAAPASVPTASAPTLAPAAATAIPIASAQTQTVVFCGILEHPDAYLTYVLGSPTGVTIVVFRTVSSRGLPELGTYVCARFNAGAVAVTDFDGLSLTEFVSFVSPGEPGYIPRP